MTPLDRAALAVADKLECTCRSGDVIRSADDLRHAETDINNHVDLIEIARAALTAIREPSEGMQTAGYGECHHPKDIPEHIWQAMIDAAIKEG